MELFWVLKDKYLLVYSFNHSHNKYSTLSAGHYTGYLEFNNNKGL
jgi:hypothetical protein